jgi:uncharacterized protein with von Willebrand factor type A (vWA) domain
MTLSQREEPQVFQSERPDEDAIATVNEVEAEIRDFVRRDAKQLRRAPEANGEMFANNVNSLVQRVSGNSLREIDNLLRELEGLREFLHSEGERVQREVAGYAQLSQTAMNSTKIITESMAAWRKHGHHPRPN